MTTAASQVRVNRAAFQQVLARVQPGLATSDVFEQSSSFVADRGWLMTYNGEIAMRTKSGLPADFVGAVRAAPLIAALEAVPDEEVLIDYSDPARFRVSGTAGRRKWFEVRMEAEILLPITTVETPEEWLDLPEDFQAALKQALVAASKNEQEFVAACVHATPEYLECCDRLQISRYHTEFPVGTSCLFRAKSAKHLTQFDVVKFGETERWVHFRNKEVVFSCTRHPDQMPDLEGMLKFRGVQMRLTKETEAAAKLAKVFTENDKTDSKVTVTLQQGRMVVSGRGAYGRGEYPVETTYAGPPMSFKVAPDALIEMVKTYDTCEIGQDSNGRNRLRVDGEKWVYMAALNPATEGEPAAEQGAAGETNEDQSDE